MRKPFDSFHAFMNLVVVYSTRTVSLHPKKHKDPVHSLMNGKNNECSYTPEKDISSRASNLTLDSVSTINLGGTCRFTGGGDITIKPQRGAFVIAGTDDSVSTGYDDSPDCKGDCKSTSNLETESPISTQPYNLVEMQLFANMHLSML